MNPNLHCVAVFTGNGYYAQWMMGDLVLFSEKAKEIFRMDYNLEKIVIDKLIAEHGNEKIYDANIDIANVTGSSTVFCPLEEFEPLCDKLLVILNELGKPCQWSGSYQQRLEDHRKNDQWKEKWTKVTSLVFERRRRELIEKLDDCTIILARDPGAKESVKRKRADLEDVVGLLESRIKRTASVPTTQSTSMPTPALEISFGMPVQMPKKKILSATRKDEDSAPQEE